MVFIITGAAEANANTVAKLLAEAWGWELIDAEHLHPHPQDRPDARRCATSLANTDPTPRIESLWAAIHLWIYEWRDVVVSCPMLSERDRKQLSKVSSLVKIVCLEASDATGRAGVFDRSVPVASSEFTAGWHAARDPRPDVLTVDSSRQVEEVIAEVTAGLIMRKSPWSARR